MAVIHLLLTLMAIFAISSSQNLPKSEFKNCSKIADIAFVIDSSSSIWMPYFETQLTFVHDIVSMFDVRPDKTRISAVSFSNRVKKEFNFNTYTKKEDVLKALKNVEYTKGDATRTYKALEMMNTDLFDPKNGARDGVIKIGIVLTDGGTNPGGYDDFNMAIAKGITQTQAQIAKDKDINMFVIGIGSGVDKQELAGMASDPDSFYLQLVPGGFTKLNTATLKQLVAWKTCEIGGVTPPPPAPTRPPTTTPIPQGDDPKKECATKTADVIFILDESYSILSQRAFQDELEFVNGIVDNFDIGPKKTQVGVIAFSDSPRVVFNLNDFNNKNDVKKAVSSITWTGGNTFTNEALDLLMRQGFSSKYGARDDAMKIAVVITDGNSTDPFKTKLQAQKVQNAGVKVFAIGVGITYKSELNVIASDPNTDYVFTVESLRALKTIKDILAYSICKDQKTEPDKECEGKLADIIFIADASTSIGNRDFQKEMNFIYNVSKLFTIGPDNVQLGLITFSDDAKMEFPLDMYRSTGEIKKALSTVHYTTGITNTHKALELMAKEGFSPANGARDYAPKICIIITDGWSTMPEQTLNLAAKAKKKIEMFSIGVGSYTVPDELNAMASLPVDAHSFQVTDYNALDEIINSLATRTCQGSALASAVKPKYR